MQWVHFSVTESSLPSIFNLCGWTCHVIRIVFKVWNSIAVILFYHTNILLGDIEEEVPHCKLTAGINIKLQDTSQRFNHIPVHRKTDVKITLVKGNFKCMIDNADNHTD